MAPEIVPKNSSFFSEVSTPHSQAAEKLIQELALLSLTTYDLTKNNGRLTFLQQTFKVKIVIQLQDNEWISVPLFDFTAEA